MRGETGESMSVGSRISRGEPCAPESKRNLSRSHFMIVRGWGERITPCEDTGESSRSYCDEVNVSICAVEIAVHGINDNPILGLQIKGGCTRTTRNSW